DCATLRPQFDPILLGEPSSTEVVGDVVKNGRRGSLTCNLTIHGFTDTGDNQFAHPVPPGECPDDDQRHVPERR
ncbi:hypothetical protein FK513_28830, partial [Klebsiella pneumoniae]|nr:hypothetical protein [Klebsiella pneumoniae]